MAPLGCDPYSLSNRDPHTLGRHGNRIQAPCTGSFNGSIDPETELHRMCNEAFIRYDEVHGNSSRQDDIPEEVENDEDGHTLDSESPVVDPNLDELLKWANTPLYPGSKVKLLHAVLLILNTCTVHGTTNGHVDELLTLLSEDILEPGNLLPKSRYEAKKFLKNLGLTYDSIHACENGCILYRGEHKDLDKCSKCDCSRYVEGSSTVPRKVLRHFPLIPRLKRMYRCKSIAGLMQHHANNRPKDTGSLETGAENENLVRSVADSKAWKHIDNMWPDFAVETRNIRLGLATDGMNPFGDFNLKHSTWPVILLNYNLPPWLVTKRFFVMLALIIPGKEAVKDHNFDVYLAPVLEELLQLWQGVWAYDVAAINGNHRFLLRAVLMWTIHDFPALGLVSGCVTKGYKACPNCGPNTIARYSKPMRKMIYTGHRRLLARPHPYRRKKSWFNGKIEKRTKPRALLTDEIIKNGTERDEWIAKGGKPGARNDPVHKHGMKRMCALWKLPYWKVRLSQTLLFMYSKYSSLKDCQINQL